MLLVATFFLVMIFGFVVFFGAPYVPSKKSDLEPAFTSLYELGETDTLVDIGSGDGVVLRMASRKGAKAVGYEINPLLVGISRWLSRRDPKVTVRLASFWSAQLPSTTTIVYTFGDSRDIKRMFQKVEGAATDLQKPLYFMSYAVAVPGVEPLRQERAHYLYLVEPLQL